MDREFRQTIDRLTREVDMTRDQGVVEAGRANRRDIPDIRQDDWGSRPARRPQTPKGKRR